MAQPTLTPGGSPGLWSVVLVAPSAGVASAEWSSSSRGLPLFPSRCVLMLRVLPPRRSRSCSRSAGGMVVTRRCGSLVCDAVIGHGYRADPSAVTSFAAADYQFGHLEKVHASYASLGGLPA